MQVSKPRRPIPEPLRGAETDTFAQDTVTVRLPEIARRTLGENDFPPETVSRLEALVHNIPAGPIRSLRDAHAPDTADWARYVAPYLGQNWLEIPWFFAETYFYRRILEATGYYRPGAHLEGHDPFIHQKRQALESNRLNIRALSEQLQRWLGETAVEHEIRQATLAHLLVLNLWGNQADLSLWPEGQADRPGYPGDEGKLVHMLVNESLSVARYLHNLGPAPARVAMILDNAGLELVHDLALADYLLSSGVARAVQFQLKAHPTFVSDAMAQDVRQTVAYLAKEDQPAVQAMAERLKRHLQSERLQLVEEFFWNSPLAGWELPARLWGQLTRFDLLISKGDANYRRLLGDRHWPFTTPLADILTYLPAPLAALRVLKSEVAAGLQPGQPETLTGKDPHWLVNGQWGLLQFVDHGVNHR